MGVLVYNWYRNHGAVHGLRGQGNNFDGLFHNVSGQGNNFGGQENSSSDPSHSSSGLVHHASGQGHNSSGQSHNAYGQGNYSDGQNLKPLKGLWGVGLKGFANCNRILYDAPEDFLIRDKNFLLAAR